MTEHVYKPSRLRDGKRIRSKSYRGRFKVLGGGELHDVPLKTTDRQVATQLLRKIVADAEREAAGILAPKRLRDASERPLAQHLQEYIEDLEAQGRDSEYVRHIKARVKAVADACAWIRLGDISADAFQSWRSKKAASAKTLNDYQCALISFLNWLVTIGRIDGNPLLKISKVERRGRETFHRRALTEVECKRLLSVSGSRELLYLTALTTGLRRGELVALRWSDLQLDGGEPCLHARASTTKNHQQSTLPLRPELVERLRIARGSAPAGSAFVFPEGIPENRNLCADFIKAGIPLQDATGGKVDFHALRHTFCTLLANNGVSARVAMEMMRHSDMKLTTQVYTDAQSLPTRQALMCLPSLVHDSLTASLTASLSPVSNCQDVSQPVADNGENNFHKTLNKNALVVACRDVSRAVEISQLAERGGFEPPVAL
jgi:integrase